MFCKTTIQHYIPMIRTMYRAKLFLMDFTHCFCAIKQTRAPFINALVTFTMVEVMTDRTINLPAIIAKITGLEIIPRPHRFKTLSMRRCFIVYPLMRESSNPMFRIMRFIRAKFHFMHRTSCFNATRFPSSIFVKALATFFVIVRTTNRADKFFAPVTIFRNFKFNLFRFCRKAT